MIAGGGGLAIVGAVATRAREGAVRVVQAMEVATAARAVRVATAASLAHHAAVAAEAIEGADRLITRRDAAAVVATTAFTRGVAVRDVDACHGTAALCAV